MKRNTLKEITRYKFDNFMSKGSSIFMSLLAVFLGLQLIVVQQGRNSAPVLPSIDSSMQNLGKTTTAWG